MIDCVVFLYKSNAILLFQSFSTNAVDVQYPVRIVKMEGPKQLGRGEYGTLKLTVSYSVQCLFLI